MCHRKLASVVIGLLITFIFTACSQFIASSNSSEGYSIKNKRPNILFVIVDDLGRQDVGVYGGKFYDTPNMDKLAAEGMRFENAYAAHPRCLPSRFAMMSGQYPARHGVPGFQDKSSKHALPLSMVTFAEQLKTAGYKTGYIGKWHLGRKGGSPKEQGFDTSILAGHAGAPPSYFYPFDVARKGTSPLADPKKKLKQFPKIKGVRNEHLTDRLATEAIHFIDDSKDGPFLLVLANYAVHTPIQGKPELVTKYKDKMQKMGIADPGPKWANDVVADVTGKVKTIQNNPVYAAMVETVDQNLGRIERELNRLGIADNTIIIFTSDHGGLSSRGLNSNRELATTNLPYRHGKGWLYEGGTRIPLIVKWPGHVAKGSVSKHQVTGTDHYPTILQMAGLPLTPDIHKDGESYLSALDGRYVKRAPLFWHSPLGRPNRTGDTAATSIIDGKWKLIKWYVLDKVELYNLATDPGEHHDLSKKKPQKTKDMLQKLEVWKRDVNAHTDKKKPLPVPTSAQDVSPRTSKISKEERKAARKRLRKACHKDKACLDTLKKNKKKHRIKERGKHKEGAGLTPSFPSSVVMQQKMAKQKSNGKNILFIAIDDLRPQIGAYGHPQMHTPNLDKLANEGIQFGRAYSNVPVCGASRASLMTGLRPTNTRFKDAKVYAQKDAPGIVTLPEFFKQNGYYTVSLGKIFHHTDDEPQAWSEKAWHPFYDAGGKATSRRDYQNPENKNYFKTHHRKGPPYEAGNVRDEAYFDGKIRVRAIEKLRELKGGKQPFFLAVGFLKPHLPFNSPRKYWDMYDRNKINLADNPLMAIGAPAEATHRWGELRKFAGMPKYPDPVQDKDARTLIHGYYASVSYSDAQVGMLLDELKRLGLDKTTIVVLWGDHGWSLGEHGLWAKHSPFNVANQVPFVILDPSKKGGKVAHGLVELLDIYPTLAELTGMKPPAHVQGVSLVPVLDNPEISVNKAVFMKWHDADMIRTDKYYLTEWRKKDHSVKARMLYDHDRDPAETVNLAEDPEYREVVARLHKQLETHLAAKNKGPG